MLGANKRMGCRSDYGNMDNGGGMEKKKKRLLEEFEWEAQWAKKRNKKRESHGRDVNGKENVVNKRRAREGAKKGAGRNNDEGSESRREEVESGGGVC